MIDTIRRRSNCSEVYVIPGFNEYWVTGNLQVYSLRRRNRGLLQLQPYYVDGQPMITLTKDGFKFKRTVKFFLQHARLGVDPTSDKLIELRRLQQQIDNAVPLLHLALQQSRLSAGECEQLEDAIHAWLNALTVQPVKRKPTQKSRHWVLDDSADADYSERFGLAGD